LGDLAFQQQCEPNNPLLSVIHFTFVSDVIPPEFMDDGRDVAR